MKVLFEGEGKPLTDQPGRLWFGLTDNYLPRGGHRPNAVNLHNRLLPVRLTRLAGDVLHGDIRLPSVEVTHQQSLLDTLATLKPV